MLERRRHALALVEAIALHIGRELRGVDQTKRHGPAQRQLRGLVDGAGGAAPQRPFDPEATDRRPGFDVACVYTAYSSFPSCLMPKKCEIIRPVFGFTHHTPASPFGSPG